MILNNLSRHVTWTMSHTKKRIIQNQRFSTRNIKRSFFISIRTQLSHLPIKQWRSLKHQLMYSRLSPTLLPSYSLLTLCFLYIVHYEYKKNYCNHFFEQFTFNLIELLVSLVLCVRFIEISVQQWNIVKEYSIFQFDWFSQLTTTFTFNAHKTQKIHILHEIENSWNFRKNSSKNKINVRNDCTCGSYHELQCRSVCTRDHFHTVSLMMSSLW